MFSPPIKEIEDTKEAIASRKIDERQTTQWSKEKGQ